MQRELIEEEIKKIFDKYVKEDCIDYKVIHSGDLFNGISDEQLISLLQ